jgi:hypothetical protein
MQNVVATTARAAHVDHDARPRRPGSGAPPSAGVSPASAASMAILASPMSRSRFFGLRSRQRRIRPRIAAGVSRGSLSNSIGPECPGPNLSALLRLHTPGHFRLSHSVYGE